jgi:hypothetical protein
MPVFEIEKEAQLVAEVLRGPLLLLVVGKPVPSAEELKLGVPGRAVAEHTQDPIYLGHLGGRGKKKRMSRIRLDLGVA